MAYHHGNLRQAFIAATTDAIMEHGPAALSLRDVARRVGVSNAAPVHHFGDKAGLLTAVAVEGFRLLDAALRSAGPDFREVGVAYVGFAVDHRAHFDVMFRPDLLRADDPDLAAARARAGETLAEGAGDPTGRLSAWSLMHGLATLWLSGSLAGTDHRGDPRDLARAVAARLVTD
jgi:AcrR family transcriptional regulator